LDFAQASVTIITLRLRLPACSYRVDTNMAYLEIFLIIVKPTPEESNACLAGQAGL